MLLQAFYSIRSERQRVERIGFNLLFRWFVGLGMDDPVCDATTFTSGANVTFDDFGVGRPNVTVAAGGVTANSMALARPIPLDAPVTTAVRFGIRVHLDHRAWGRGRASAKGSLCGQ